MADATCHRCHRLSIDDAPSRGGVMAWCIHGGFANLIGSTEDVARGARYRGCPGWSPGDEAELRRLTAGEEEA